MNSVQRDGGISMKTVVSNKKARFQYHLMDSYEAGIELVGTEVKSLRLGGASLIDAYCKIESGEIFLMECNISQYTHGKPKLKSEMTELEVQGLFYEAMAKRNIEPVLTLVFSEDSSLSYRHNLSRDVKLGKRGFASICARRRGLIVSSSRSFMFEAADDVIRQHQQNCYVDAVAMGSSRPGVKLSEAFGRLIEAYEKVGRASEWKFHHQGGIAGYLPREVHANLKSDVYLREGNAVAWNPTIRGTKSEDTVLIGNERNSIISFPEDSTWPALEFEVNDGVVRRPASLLIG